MVSIMGLLNSAALALYYICFLVAHPLYMGTSVLQAANGIANSQLSTIADNYAR